MNLLAPDHRTSHAAFQSLAQLAAGRVSRLNKDIFLLIRPSVVLPSPPPLHLLVNAPDVCPLLFLRPLCLSTFTDCLPFASQDPPPLFPSSQLLIIGCGSTDGTRKSIGISSLISHSQSLAHVLPHSSCMDNQTGLLLLYAQDPSPALSLLMLLF